MSLDVQVDVVVIGFGVAGAAAALAAASTGARVLALDQKSALRERRWGVSPRARSRAALRAAAREAGVEVRPLCRVHELVVGADQVGGIGYAALPERGATAVAYRWLDRLSHGAAHSVARALARVADRIWQSGFRVGEITCASVVLALDPRHWDFVGPAVWSVTRSRKETGTSSSAGSPRHLRLLAPEEAEVGPSPELSARLWCAGREAVALAPGQRRELRVDDATGAVLIGAEPTVSGLYSAVPTGRSTSTESDCGGPLIAGTRAGRQAADSAAGRSQGQLAFSEGEWSVIGR